MYTVCFRLLVRPTAERRVIRLIRLIRLISQLLQRGFESLLLAAFPGHNM